MLKTYGERIQYALEVRNMQPIDLSKQSGIGKGSISAYMSNTYKPKQDAIYLMSKVLKVNPIWLMGLTEEMELTPYNEVSNWLGDILKTNDQDVIRVVSKLSKLDKKELLMIEAILDSYQNKKD